ncbi:MAG: carbohydrate kinase family protein [Rhizobiales bacterium]|nr:carbohydrate kinase family protein [Hyphomicrobiales bacterium]
MSRSGIVCVGTAILDIVNIIDTWPAEEQVAAIARTEFGAGGPPVNAAAGLVKLGAPFPVALIGAVGDDAYGERLIENVRSLGVDPGGLRRIAGAVTSHTHVMSSAATGRRTFFHQTGVNALLEESDLMPASGNAKLFYGGSPGITRKLDAAQAWPRIFKTAQNLGIKTCLELVPAPGNAIAELVPPCLPFIDYMVVNEHEAGAVTGLTLAEGRVLDWRAARTACVKLLEMGVSTLAAVHHPDGAIAVMRNGGVAARGSVKVAQSEIAGSVGAGDAFYAGMLLGIHEGWPLGKCLELGNAAAAASLHSPTTCASIRPWAECLAYAEEKGTRPAPSL